MNDLSANVTKPERVIWLDVAKALGIFLVFYGHFVEKFIALKAPTALEQMNWIYSFHMPAFFLLAGLVYKRREMATGTFFLRQIRTRLVPVWAFNVIGMFIWIGVVWFEGETGWIQTKGWDSAISHCGEKLKSLFLYGRHGFNVLTWFLICLFVIEVWQFLLRDLLKSRKHLAVSMACFGALAVGASVYFETVSEVLGARRHWWEFSTALMAMFFYQLGALLKSAGFVAMKLPRAAQAALCLVCLGVTLATFNFNQNYHHSPAVPLMVDAGYGNVWLFMITSLSGSFFLIYLSQLLRFSRFLAYVGTITLSLMLLDGFLHFFANQPLAEWIARTTPNQNVYAFTGMCLGVTLLSLAVCWPVTVFMERFTPYLLGRPFSRKKPRAR